MAADPYYLTAAEAAAKLGVTRATLYAYASRGQLRSEAIPGRPRERRYYREDVERLRDRKDSRRDPATAAARALRWGGPILDSAITLIQDGAYYYRGRNAVALSETASLEEVAEVLWSAGEAERGTLFSRPPVLSDRELARLRSTIRDPAAACQAALAVGASADAAAHNLHPSSVRRAGARILQLLTAVIAAGWSHEPIHAALQRAWRPKDPAAGNAIRIATALCADHELNVSAFVARCAASAGASPYDVVAAAMATLKGHRHGGGAARVLAIAGNAKSPASARDLVTRHLRRGERVPGFGHPLYPHGDPRAALLLRVASAGPRKDAWRLFQNLARAGSAVLHDRPNLDFGLAAVSRTYGLPDDAPLLIFTLGRTIGWIAHAIEEYESGRLIRPRARYVGPEPHDSRRRIDIAGRPNDDEESSH